MSYYDDLGLTQSATAAQIEQTYRALAQRFNPANHPGKEQQAEAMLRRVEEAYAVLKNSRTREAYDSILGFANGSGGDIQGAITIIDQRPRSSKTESIPSQPKKASWFSLKTLGFAIAAVLLIAAAIVTVAMKPPSKADVKAKADKKVQEEQVAAAKADKAASDERAAAAKAEADAQEAEKIRLATKLELERATAQRKADAVVIRTKLSAVRQEGATAIDSLRKLKAELDEWESKISPLLTDERGKAIAADDNRVAAFEAAWNKMQFKRTDGKVIQERLQLLLAPVDAELAKDEPAWEPDPKLTKQITDERAALDAKAEEIRSFRRRIELLIQDAEGQGKTSALTLEAAMSDLGQRNAKTINEVEAKNAKDRVEDKKAAAIAAAAENANPTLKRQKKIKKLKR